MFERFRSDKAGPFVIGAAILFLFANLGALGITYSYVHDAVYQEYASNKAYADAKNEFEKKCTGISTVEGVIGCFRDAVEKARQPQRAEEDLRAQKEMATWAFWMLVVTGLLGVITIGLTIVGVVYVIWTFEQTRRQADTAEKQLATSERPWLKLDVVAKSTFVIEHPKARITLDWHISNIGKTPAIHVELRGISHETPIKPTDEKMNAAFDSFITAYEAAPVRHVILPQDTLVITTSVEYDITTRDGVGDGTGHYIFMLLHSALYMTQFSSKTCETSKVYYIGTRGADGSTLDLEAKNQTVPQRDVQFNRHRGIERAT